eukprot:snap_masked-scaffold_8-processed-gene-10.45-mRNA-1 protein AED:1.00 eAED:1.00 QI:0/-1/0/0/-1/1/1/0/279
MKISKRHPLDKFINFPQRRARSVPSKAESERCNLTAPPKFDIFPKSRPSASIFSPVECKKHSAQILFQRRKQEKETNHDEAFCLENEKFHPYRGIIPAKLFTTRKPKSMLRKVTKWNPLTSKDARKNMFFTSKMLNAAAKIKEIARLRDKFNLSLRFRYKHGILGVDSPEDKNSILFPASAKVELLRKKCFKSRHEYRHKILRDKREGFMNCLEEKKYKDLSSEMCRKRKVVPNLQNQKTFERIFITDKEKLIKRQIKRQLRAKKDYRNLNIITNVPNN